MANYQYSSDILDDILNRADEPTDGTSDYEAEALRLLNRAYYGILNGGTELDPELHETWWWLRKDSQGVLTLNPVIETGTVSVTNNSTSITFSSGPTPSVANRYIKIDDHADVFLISAHTAAATAATLESVYTGTTDTAASYKVFQLDYTLASDVMYLSSPMRFYQDGGGEIVGMPDVAELHKRWPLQEVSAGVPRAFAMVGQQKVRFSHYGGTSSTDLIKIDYEYTKVATALTDSGSEEPLVPIHYRYILSDWALGLLLGEKNDSRAVDFLTLAKQGVSAMAMHNRQFMVLQGRGKMGRILTRQGHVSRFMSPLRTSSGLIIG